MPLIKDTRLEQLGIRHGTTVRQIGNMKEPGARLDFFAKNKIDPAKAVFLKQVHGSGVVRLETQEELRALTQSPPPEADAWLLRGAGCVAAVFTADCVPLFLWDSKAKIIGLAHAGWRGVADGLPHKLAAMMFAEREIIPPVRAFLGPYIHKCCFEVGPEVAAAFAGSVDRTNGRQHVCLAHAITAQLVKAGLKTADIRDSGKCTCCLKDELFSYRRDKVLSAMMSFVEKSDI